MQYGEEHRKALFEDLGNRRNIAGIALFGYGGIGTVHANVVPAGRQLP